MTPMETSFDTSEFLIKREVPDEPPPSTDDLVDLDHTTDYPFTPAVVKVLHNERWIHIITMGNI